MEKIKKILKKVLKNQELIMKHLKVETAEPKKRPSEESLKKIKTGKRVSKKGH